MFCPNCGAPIDISISKFCGTCGENIENASELLNTWYSEVQEEPKDDISEPIISEPHDNSENILDFDDSTLNEEYLSGKDDDVCHECDDDNRAAGDIYHIGDNDGRESDNIRHSEEHDNLKNKKSNQHPMSLQPVIEKIHSVSRGRLVLILAGAVVGIVGIIAIIRSVAFGNKENISTDYVGNHDSSFFQDSSVADAHKSNEEFSSDLDLVIKESEKFQEVYAPVTYEQVVELEIEADDIQLVIRKKPVYDNNVLDYNSIGKFKYDRVSVIRKDGRYGLIAYNGLPLCDIYFDSIYAGYEMKYMLERIDNDVYYTLNDKYEQVRLTDEDSITAITGNSDSPLLIWIDNESCLYDSDGNLCDNYQKAAAALYLNSYDDILGMTIDSNSQYVLVNQGEPIRNVLFDDVGCFSNGVIPAMLNGKWGYVNQNGDIILPFEFESTFQDKAYNATDNMIVVKKNGKFALFDFNGNKLIEYGEFEQLRPSYNGMMWVKKNGRWGVISVNEGVRDIQPEMPVFEIEGYIAQINSPEGLRLREKADTDSAVLGILSHKQAVEVLATDDDWFFIRVKDGVYGWVKGDYLQ